MLDKPARLLRLLLTNREEFVDRISAIYEVRSERLSSKTHVYSSLSIHDGLAVLSSTLGIPLGSFLTEQHFFEIQATMDRALMNLPGDAPLGRFHNGDPTLVQIIYALARALGPERVVETGVCYGVTTGYLLTALQQNGTGQLFSIDLPPLGENADSFVGSLVPENLKSRWTLQRGSSRRLLPTLLQTRGNIGMFVHDSLHTLGNMRFEFAAAWHSLGSGSVLVSDDIEGNSAFSELSSWPGVKCSLVLESEGKKSLIGVAVKC